MDVRHPSSEGKNPADASVSDRLDSWKAIAQFLRRDVRTVQRWEASEGLPVYRHQHSRQGSIYAYKSEIDAWWKTRPSALRHRSSRQRPTRSVAHTLRSLSYPKMAMYALLTIALALSVVKAKQMFLNRRKARQTEPVSQPVTLAVLPFQGISSSPADINVALNITEELTTDFRSVHGLRVVDQGAVMPVPNIAADPQHGAQPVYSGKLLRGTARRDGNRIQIAVQLVDASSGASIWSKTFERSGADLLETERDIASAIANEVENSLRTGSPEA